MWYNTACQKHRNICFDIYNTSKRQQYPSCCAKWIVFCI